MQAKKATLAKKLGYYYPEIAFIVSSLTDIMSFYLYAVIYKHHYECRQRHGHRSKSHTSRPVNY